MSSAIVLFSGGLDSTTCLYLARQQEEKILALSFDYGQRHTIELAKATAICQDLAIEHLIIHLDASVFANSSLVDRNIEVVKNQLSTNEIPNTYVPGRNLLFLSFATSLAEGRAFDRIYIGVNALDYSGYPDCRPEFIDSFTKTIQIGTKQGQQGKTIEIITPLIQLTKKEIVLKAKQLTVPFGKTHSCYDPQDGKPCGQCESCLLRQKGFAQAGMIDG